MSKKWMIGIALLLAVTGIVAAVHRNKQDAIPCLVILQGNQETAVSFSDLNQGTFSGELTDGKGDVTSHSYTGILLRDLLEAKGIDPARISGVTVTSADHYSVSFTGPEILQENKVYAATAVDGKTIEGIDPGSDGVQVIVFGDPNSRRCVRFAQKITIGS